MQGSLTIERLTNCHKGSKCKVYCEIQISNPFGEQNKIVFT